MAKLTLLLIAIGINNGSFAQSGNQTSGTQSPIQNNQNGPNFADYGTKIYGPVIIGLQPVPQNSSLQKKQEALLTVQHPTTLQVTGVRWMTWFGDKMPFLSIEITNTSDMPALNVQITLLDNNTAPTLLGLKPYKLSESYTQKILKGMPVGITGKAKWEGPIASQTDVQSIVQSDCITSAGLEFQRLRAPRIDDRYEGSYFSDEVLQYLKVSYMTIFGQKLSFISSVVIDMASRKSNYMVARYDNKAVPLRCVGDPGWNTLISG